MLCSRSVHVVKGLAVWGGKQALFFHLSSPNWGEQLWPTLQAPGFGLHGSSGLLTATQPSRVELQMAGDHGKGQSCHVLLKSLHTVFSTWVPPHVCVDLGEEEVVFLSISISQGESRDDRGVSGLPSFFYPRNTVCGIPRICPCIWSAGSSIHTGSSSFTQWLKHRQSLHWYCSTHNYTVLWQKLDLSMHLTVISWDQPWFGGSIVLSGKSRSDVSSCDDKKSPGKAQRPKATGLLVG